MLKSFRFKNFRSFRDDAEIIFSTQSSQNPKDLTIKAGDNEIIKTAAFYGANASGKSNIFKAFATMQCHINNEYKNNNEYDDFGIPNTNYSSFLYEPFLLDENSANSDTLFEAEFIVINKNNNTTQYKYGFSTNNSSITAEWLSSKTKSSKNYKNIFRREENSIDYSGLPSSAQLIVEGELTDKLLILTVGKANNINILKKVYECFLNTVVLDFSDPYQYSYTLSQVKEMFLSKRDMRNDFTQFINNIDNSIKSFSVDDSYDDYDYNYDYDYEDDYNDDYEDDDYNFDNNDSEDYESDYDDDEFVDGFEGDNVIDLTQFLNLDQKTDFLIDALHDSVDGKFQKPISLINESSGINKMFTFFPFLQGVLLNGETLFADEFETNVHPILLQKIINVFSSSKTNPYNAQLIFTSHSPHLMNGVLKKDEIWFVEKDSNGLSRTYPLTDFEDNENVSGEIVDYAKRYINGDYGAVPVIDDISLDLRT